MKKMRIQIICGYGVGSSVMISLKLKAMLKEVGIEGEVIPSGAGESHHYDWIDMAVCTPIFKDLFREGTYWKMVLLGKNILDWNELRGNVMPILKEWKEKEGNVKT